MQERYDNTVATFGTYYLLPDWFLYMSIKNIARLLGLPQPQIYPPVALNQYPLVNRTPKHFINMLQGPTNILK